MRDSTDDDQPKATPYELMGGETGLRTLVNRFYDIMDSDPAAATVRAMHAPDLTPMRKSLFQFMSGWLGGPRLYERCVVSAHRSFSIGVEERDQWLMCIQRALTETHPDPALQEMLKEPLFSAADFLRNR